MEMALQASPRTSLFALASIVASILPAIASFLLLVVIARGRTARLWLMPAWLAAAALAPVLATFFGVRLVIAAFQSMARSGSGGLASISAGLWQAVQPAVAAAWVACVLALVTLVLALRAVGELEDDDAPRLSSRTSLIASAAPVLSIAAVATTALLFRGILHLVLNLLDPHAPQTGGIASTSALVTSRLVLTAATALVMALALIVAIVALLAANRDREPSPTFARALVFMTVLAVLGSVVNVAMFRGWSERLKTIAMTGQMR